MHTSRLDVLVALPPLASCSLCVPPCVCRPWHLPCSSVGDTDEIDLYENGKVTNGAGAWRSGENGAHYGLLMPGTPLLGSRFHQETAPALAMYRAEVVADDETFAGPDGPIAGCVHIATTTPLAPQERSAQVHAPGIGKVSDGPLRLVRHGKPR